MYYTTVMKIMYGGVEYLHSTIYYIRVIISLFDWIQFSGCNLNFLSHPTHDDFIRSWLISHFVFISSERVFFYI